MKQLYKQVKGILETFSWGGHVAELIERNPHVANFALAWVATKFTEPVRLLVTVGIVPKVGRFLGKKPPSSM